MVKEGICMTMHSQRLMTLTTLTMMMCLIHAKGLTTKIIHLRVSLEGKNVVEFSERQTWLTRIQPCIKNVDIEVVSVVAVTVTTVVIAELLLLLTLLLVVVVLLLLFVMLLLLFKIARANLFSLSLLTSRSACWRVCDFSECLVKSR
jgi:hypothetical protein